MITDNDARFGMGKAIPHTHVSTRALAIGRTFREAMALHQRAEKWLSGLQGPSHAIALLSLSYSYLASENL